MSSFKVFGSAFFAADLALPLALAFGLFPEPELKSMGIYQMNMFDRQRHENLYDMRPHFTQDF